MDSGKYQQRESKGSKKQRRGKEKNNVTTTTPIQFCLAHRRGLGSDGGAAHKMCGQLFPELHLGQAIERPFLAFLVEIAT
jgi:hypothetical protein